MLAINCGVTKALYTTTVVVTLVDANLDNIGVLFNVLVITYSASCSGRGSSGFY